MARVLRALERLAEVIPRALARRRRDVGLLDAVPDLGEEVVLQRPRGCEDGVGVPILGFEVRNDLGIVPVTEPVPRVDAHISVAFEFDGSGRRRWRCQCHGGGVCHRKE